jgi:V8-like Glu-specific endopeptidase
METHVRSKSLFRGGNAVRFILPLALCACVVEPPTETILGAGSAREAIIVDEDDRGPLTDLTLMDQVGTLKRADVVTCTGFFTGSDEIMTARHCLADLSHLSDLTFISGNGDEYVVVDVRDASSNADIVRLTVEGADGSARGVPLRPGHLDPTKPVLLVAFDKEFEELVVAPGDAPIAEGAPGVLLHSMDTIPGSSGAPIVQDGWAVAIHIGALHAAEGEEDEIDFSELDDELAADEEPLRNVAIDINARRSADLSRVDGSLCLERYYGWGRHYHHRRGHYWGKYRRWGWGHGGYYGYGWPYHRHRSYHWGKRWGYGCGGHYRYGYHGGRSYGRHYGYGRYYGYR